MLGFGPPRTGSSMSLSRPCSLHAPASRLLATGRCLPRAPRRASVRRSSSTTSSSSSRSSQSHKAIFDRVAEREQLDSLQHTRPADITVVLGPRSCGKTALLQELFSNQADAVYVDCRVINAATPASLIEALLSTLAARLDPQKDAAAALKNVPGVLSGLLRRMQLTEKDATLSSSVSVTVQDLVQTFLDSKERQQNLNGVYAALRELLTVMEEGRDGDGSKWPVVVIDEANKLMKWTDNYPDELDSFLSNLVVLSKQENRCHVILATSEYAFQAWLRGAIGSRFWKAVVIGDFPQAVAREFLARQLEQKGSGSVLDDQAWRKVFQVCGGNAGDLGRLAAVIDFKGGNWDAALRVLWAGEVTRWRSLARGGDGWSSAQFAGIALQLLDTKYHAVPLQEAGMLLGQLVADRAGSTPESQAAAGLAALQCLVQANVVSVRPTSPWATDIPDEAFAATEDIVTAPSSLELYCIGRLRGELEQTLQQWQQQQAQQQHQAQQKHHKQHLEQVASATRAVAEAPRPPSPGSSPEVQEVQRQIAQVEQQVKQVEQQIKQAEQEIKEAKQHGDNEEVAVLRSKEQQLCEEKRQLRAGLVQLREKELLLLRIYAGSGSYSNPACESV